MSASSNELKFQRDNFGKENENRHNTDVKPFIYRSFGEKLETQEKKGDSGAGLHRACGSAARGPIHTDWKPSAQRINNFI